MNTVFFQRTDAESFTLGGQFLGYIGVTLAEWIVASVGFRPTWRSRENGPKEMSQNVTGITMRPTSIEDSPQSLG
jgi:hypothetical protein